jgi:lipoprotein-anchoring transpeptidase ErfK/SrfK
MGRIFLSVIWLCLLSVPTLAQWPPWADEAFGGPRRWSHGSPPPLNPNPPAPSLADGGERPQIAPQAPPVVAFPYAYPVASIVIDTSGRRLYYILEGNRAYAYPISVGREGFSWTGTEKISRKQEWPDWYPPEEMRQRDRTLPEKMTGGMRNPLGAMALYLGNSLYRIHGTNDANSIGQAQSSGCFRMMNSAVVHLAGLADVGTTVTVVASLRDRQDLSQVAPPATADRRGGLVTPTLADRAR